MGLTDQDVTYDWNNVPRRVTVSSFLMDESEVSNSHYREFEYWTRRVYGESYPQEVLEYPCLIPWSGEKNFLSMNHWWRPISGTLSYADYPVIGVNLGASQ